jgi:hypothetical protein
MQWYIVRYFVWLFALVAVVAFAMGVSYLIEWAGPLWTVGAFVLLLPAILAINGRLH